MNKLGGKTMKQFLSLSLGLLMITMSWQSDAQEARKRAYMDIVSVVALDPSQGGSSLYASDVKELQFQVFYNGLSSKRVNVHLLYKLTRPDGELILQSDMDSFTDEMDFTVTPKKGSSGVAARVLNPGNGKFIPGEYTFELWYEGRRIHKYSFDLLKKADEASFLSFDKTVYSVAGEGAPLAMKVLTDASSWTVIDFPEWCDIVELADDSIILKVAPNISSGERLENLVIGVGEKTAEAAIYQPVADNELYSGEWMILIQNAFSKGAETFDGGVCKRSKGHVVALYDDGSIYAGDWQNGKRQGYGIYLNPGASDYSVFKDSPFYSGYWDNDKRDGVCLVFDVVGNLSFSGGYEANERDHQMDEELDTSLGLRFESLMRTSGDCYVGETKYGIPDGFGLLLSPNGDIWSGEWVRGERTDNGDTFVYDPNDVVKNQVTEVISTAKKSLSKAMRRIRGEENAYDSDMTNTKRADEVLDEMPKFNGGDFNDFAVWVSSELHYPAEARMNKITGTVKLSFTIDVKGRLTDATIVSGVHPSLDKEALRVVMSSPRWEPGRLNDTPVPVTLMFPVVFTIYDEE